MKNCAPNIRFWSDFADKTRWMLIKNTADTIGYSKDGIWTIRVKLSTR